MAFDVEDFAYPPAGGRIKWIVVGMVIPAIIAHYAVNAWLSEAAYWPGGRSGGVTVRGESARAMAALYMSVASFIHFRWFWGLIQAARVFKIGTISSLLIFLGALIWALSVT